MFVFKSTLEEQRCRQAPEIPNGEGILGNTEQHGQTQEMIFIDCNEGYSAKIEELTCRDGQWDLNGSLDDICKCESPQPLFWCMFLWKDYRV